MYRIVLIFLVGLLTFSLPAVYSSQGMGRESIAVGNGSVADKSGPTVEDQTNVGVATTLVYNASTEEAADYSNSMEAIIVLFVQAFIMGLLAVFTPYIYTIVPFTTGYITRNTKSKKDKVIKTLIYAFTLIIVFTLIGVLASFLIKVTGLHKYTDHWIFNVFFFRIFAILGISFLGAFSIKVPSFLINAMAQKAKKNNIRGIIIMALTLPVASFASTFPIVGLVLVLAGNVNIIGPAVGLFGFSVGLSLPFVYPRVLAVFVRSKSLLNNVKVVMGFLSIMIALKLASKADVSLELNLIGRELFLEIWIGLWVLMGMYMLGFVKFSDDTETEQNMYGQPYISLSRFFIAIASLVFAVYLLPGIWGAPLKGVAGFLP